MTPKEYAEEIQGLLSEAEAEGILVSGGTDCCGCSGAFIDIGGEKIYA